MIVTSLASLAARTQAFQLYPHQTEFGASAGKKSLSWTLLAERKAARLGSRGSVAEADGSVQCPVLAVLVVPATKAGPSPAM